METILTIVIFLTGTPVTVLEGVYDSPEDCRAAQAEIFAADSATLDSLPIGAHIVAVCGDEALLRRIDQPA